jgi:hypothetical protein
VKKVAVIPEKFDKLDKLIRRKYDQFSQGKDAYQICYLDEDNEQIDISDDEDYEVFKGYIQEYNLPSVKIFLNERGEEHKFDRDIDDCQTVHESVLGDTVFDSVAGSQFRPMPPMMDPMTEQLARKCAELEAKLLAQQQEQSKKMTKKLSQQKKKEAKQKKKAEKKAKKSAKKLAKKSVKAQAKAIAQNKLPEEKEIPLETITNELCDMKPTTGEKPEPQKVQPCFDYQAYVPNKIQESTCFEIIDSEPKEEELKAPLCFDCPLPEKVEKSPKKEAPSCFDDDARGDLPQPPQTSKVSCFDDDLKGPEVMVPQTDVKHEFAIQPVMKDSCNFELEQVAVKEPECTLCHKNLSNTNQYVCSLCADLLLCEDCEKTTDHSHVFVKVPAGVKFDEEAFDFFCQKMLGIYAPREEPRLMKAIMNPLVKKEQINIKPMQAKMAQVMKKDKYKDGVPANREDVISLSWEVKNLTAKKWSDQVYLICSDSSDIKINDTPLNFSLGSLEKGKIEVEFKMPKDTKGIDEIKLFLYLFDAEENKPIGEMMSAKFKIFK